MWDKMKTLESWILSQVGSGYVWGGTGQVLTQAELNRLVAQYPDHVNSSIVSKWIGKSVYDCATFVRAGLKSVGISITSGASSQYFEKLGKKYWVMKGTVDHMPKNCVLCMYRATSSTVMQHTGFKLSNGIQVDARGSAQGVIKTNYGTYKWTHWAIPIGLYSEAELEVIRNDLKGVELPLTSSNKAVVVTESGDLNMRAAARTTAVILARIPMGAIVEILEDEDPEWWKVSYKDSVGWCSTSFLKKVEDSSADTQVPTTPKTLEERVEDLERRVAKLESV